MNENAKIRVLIAEDDPIQNDLLKDALELESDMACCGQACDGLEALAKLQTEQPDVLLLDIVMPNMDGVDLLNELRENPPPKRPKVIAISAYGQEHIARAALKIRAQLVASRSAFANQLRGMLKLFGLRMGSATTPNKRRERLEALFTQRPDLKPVLHPLIESIEALEAQISKSGKLLAARAGADPVATKLMSVPGVGPVTALAFIASIEDPGRFARSSEVGAYAGLVPRRNQSGERDYKGHISKAGDAMLRHALYEAANSLLVRVKRPCALQEWGKRLAISKGPKRARVAVARKLAALLHRLWQSDTAFRWAS